MSDYIKLVNGIPVEMTAEEIAERQAQGAAWEAEAQARANAIRIAALKQLLADTDYVALADYDKSKPEVLAQRQAWREEIRTLEAK
jgi:hypothetical protein